MVGAGALEAKVRETSDPECNRSVVRMSVSNSSHMKANGNVSISNSSLFKVNGNVSSGSLAQISRSDQLWDGDSNHLEKTRTLFATNSTSINAHSIRTSTSFKPYGDRSSDAFVQVRNVDPMLMSGAGASEGKRTLHTSKPTRAGNPESAEARFTKHLKTLTPVRAVNGVFRFVCGAFSACIVAGCVVQCYASRYHSHHSGADDNSASFVWTRVDEQIFEQALPNIVSNMSMHLIGVVDTAVAGHLGVSELTAVGVGVSVFNSIHSMFTFLRKGTSGIAGQASGRRDYAEVRATGLRGICLGFLSGMLLLVYREHIVHFVFEYIQPPKGSIDECRAYFMARILSAPVALANFAVQGFLCGMLKGRQVLYQQFILNLANAFCCIVLATSWGFGMGVVGIGYAASLANVIAFINGMCQVWSTINGGLSQEPLPGQLDLSRLFNMDRIAELLNVSATLAVRSFCFILIQSGFTAIGSRLTTPDWPVLPANLLLLQLHYLMEDGMNGFSTAAEALVAQAIGSNDSLQLRNILKRSFLWGLSMMFMCCFILAIWGPSMVIGLTSDMKTQEAALWYLHWVVSGSLLGVWAFLFEGFFVGATLGIHMLLSTLFAIAAFAVVEYITVGGNLGLKGPWNIPLLHLGNDGLWIGFYWFLGLRALGLTVQWKALMDKARGSTPDRAGRGPDRAG